MAGWRRCPCPRFWVALAILAAGASVFCGYLWCVDTYHFAVVEPGALYRDGLQGLRRFRNAYQLHPFKAVLNLQSDADLEGAYKEQVAEEKLFCTERGIRWFHIPMERETPPAPKQVAEMLRIVGDPANQPVFMHDSQGVVRAGMMVAAWQIERMDYDPERALEEVLWWGHRPNAVLLAYIRTYKRL